jgi:tetratricopeptide (TPR) repeat protein
MTTQSFILALMLLPGVALAGCAAAPGARGPMLADSSTTPAAATMVAQDAAPATVKVQDPPGPVSAVPDVPVDVDAMYKVLVAEFAGRRGRLDLALDHYLDVARRTGDPAVAERAVRIAVYARDEVRGLEAARLWAASAQPDHDARQVYGALLVRAGRLEEATDVLMRLVQELAAVDEDVFNRMASMLARERARSASIQVMEALVSGYAGSAAAQYALAQLLGRFEEFDKALLALERVRTIKPDHEAAAVFHAQILQRQNKGEAAIESLAAFLADYPQANTARLTYGRLLVDAKRYDEARAQFQQLAQAVPDNAEIAYALGLLLLQTNDLAQAEAQFRKITEVPERRETAWFYIGQIAESREDRAGALDAYRRVDRGEHHVNAQVRAAVLMAEGGDVRAAREHLHALRGRNRQESVRIYRAEAEVLTRNEMLDDAMGVYDASLQEFPQDGGLLYARAMLAGRMDRVEQVERDLRDVLSREPDNADALNALGYTLADRTERYQEAYDLIKRAHELKPDDHYVVDSLGWVLYRLGRLDEAIKHLRHALTIQADPEVAAHLGEVLWVAGDREGAKEVWNTALKAQPEDKRLLDVIKRFGL